MITNAKIGRWLNKIADELDARFGPHPQIPRSQVQQIAGEMVDKSDEYDKVGLKSALNTAIANAFRGNRALDH